jgi:hypothetical protein
MSVRDLAEQIAVSDQNRCIESLCEEAIEEVETALHHVHVPKLDQAGYLDYDVRNRIAGLTERGRDLRLGVDADCDPPSGERIDRISVDLCSDTVDRLHEVIRHDERFDGRMRYDAVIGAILSDVELDGRVDANHEQEEEAR